MVHYVHLQPSDTIKFGHLIFQQKHSLNMSRILTTLIVISLTLTGINIAHSQNATGDTVLVFLEQEEAQMGDAVCVDVKVNNFVSINSFQTSVLFDPFQLRFDSLDNLNPEIPFTGENFGFVDVDCGIFRFNFFRVDPTFDFPDSTTILSMCFTVVGEPGDFAPVIISDFPIVLEVIQDFEPIEATMENGGVFIEPPTTIESIIKSCAATDTIMSDGSMEITTFGPAEFYPLVFSYQNELDGSIAGIVTLDSDGQSLFIDSLPAGAYNYIITSEGDTLSSGSKTVFDHGPVFSEFTVILPSCHDASDGSIRLDTVSEDRCVVPVWSTGELYESSLSGLANGTYIHTFKDAGGCEFVETFVFETEPLEVALDVVDNSCPGESNGSITAIASGGTPFAGDTYRYHWSDGESQTSINSFRDSLTSGTYEITITDSNECQVVESIEIINESGLDVEIDVLEDIVCFGDSTAQVQLNVSYEGRTETPEFIYELDFDQGEVAEEAGSLIFSELPPGFYSLTLTDTLFDGCVLVYSFEITQPDTSLELILLDISDESCEGENDGSISLDITGGEPDADGNYNIVWSDGAEGAVNSDLGEGMYQVTVTDVRGCEVVDSFELQTNIPPVVVESEVTDALCFGEASGSISVEVLAGTGGPAEVTWDHGQTGEVATELTAGEYTAVVSDTLGCATEFSATVGQPDSIAVEANITDESAAGEADGSIGIDVNGGTPPYEFDWDDSVLSSDEGLAFDLAAGEYCVIITDANDCTWEGCFEVDLTSSIAYLGDELSLSIFPNPTPDFVTIELVDNAGQRMIEGVYVSSIDGRVVYEREGINSGNVKISTGNWASGIYLIALRYEGGETVQRLMVQR